MIDIGTAIRYYKREEIQEELIIACQSKECVARYGDRFGKRPDVLKYKKDVLQLAQNGATSFHASEELWSYPLRLGPMMAKGEMDELRIGWDLVLDIDCAFLEYSKIAADEIIKILKRHGVSSISIKFSGNKGFHIGVPFEAFPETISGKDSRLMFPEAARNVAAYIKEQIKDNVRDRLMEREGGIGGIIAKTGKQPSEEQRIKHSDLNGPNFEGEAKRKISLYIESILNIDTVLISSRHLYRMPYSLHEKSGLVSMPLDPPKVMEFVKEYAIPENVSVSKLRFLDRSLARCGETTVLFDNSSVKSMESKVPIVFDKEERKISYVQGTQVRISEEYFPPCIKKLLEGVDDGRKRGLFILMNFLSSVGWGYKDVETCVKEWNKRNKPPLGEPYVQGQLSYHRHKKGSPLPPNCSNEGYYSDMQIKCSEAICLRFKNPVAFSKKKGNLYK